MQQTLTRSLVETIVRNKLGDLEKNPERTTRNLIDMALHFSKGRFQKNFFNIAQTMLQDEHSPYYQLIYHLAVNVNKERLISFGMNLGYNSCTYGANIIREKEQKYHFNIPWYITLELNEDIIKNKPDIYYDVITEGKNLGIFTWSIITYGHLEAFIPLLEENKDCAFFLLCSPCEISESILDRLSSIQNFMIVMEYDEDKHETFYTLQSRKLLYAAYVCYDDETVSDILNNELLCSISETNALLAIFLPLSTCSEEGREKVSAYAAESRNSPIYKTLPYDYFHDNRTIDCIISSDSCTIWFDTSGKLLNRKMQDQLPEHADLFNTSLEQILKTTCAKR